MKKILFLLVLTTVIFAGCSSSSLDLDEVGGTITVVTSRTDAKAEALFDQIEADFIEMYPTVDDIVWESYDDYDSQMTTAMNSDDFGDVVFIPWTIADTPEKYQDFYEPLGSVTEVEKDYRLADQASYDGEVYGLPVALNMLGLIYNQDVFTEAGVTDIPTSTQEMLDACGLVKENTGSVCFYTNYNSTLSVWGGALSSYGTDYYMSDTLQAKTAFEEGQPIREIMDFFYEMADNGYIEDDPITDDFAQSEQMLADGDVGMIMMGSQEVAFIQALSKNPDAIKIAPFPVEFDGTRHVPLGPPDVIAINKNSNNIATSKAFVEFFVSEASGYANDIGGVSPDKNAVIPDEYIAFEELDIVRTAPISDPDIMKEYNYIANTSGINDMSEELQQTINIALYPDQNESYDDYIASLEKDWNEAALSYNNE